MKKSKLLLPLLALSLVVVGCNTNNNNSSEATSTQSESSSVLEGFNSISDVSSLFQTYNSSQDYNFMAKYSYSTVYQRQYVDTVSTDYQFMNGITQLTYELNGTYSTDYLYENPEKDIYTYYLDMGAQKEYQTISGTNQYYAQYVAAIDTMNISDIDWAENFLVNEDKKVLVTKDSDSLLEMGKHIFGDKTGEYWEDLKVSYKDGYITKIEAISIYMERVYYFTVTLSDHTWVNIELPKASQEYVGAKPFYSDEVYRGTTLTDDQASIIEFLDDPRKANYTVSTLWEQVQNGSVTTNTVTTSSKYADGNASYTYKSNSDNLTHNDFLISNSNGTYTYYADDGMGVHTSYMSGTQEYSSNVSTFALDQINLSSLKASDFLYNDSAKCFMPKDAATERKLVASVFGQADYYFGLHIYFADGKITKVETSLFMEQSNQVASYKKTYTISDIGTTSITYPSDVDTTI